MNITCIDRLNHSLKIYIEPTKVNNALVDKPESEPERFTDTVDLIIIDNYNEQLHEKMNGASLEGLNILNIDTGDILIIENVPCKVIAIFDGFIRMEAPEIGKAPQITYDDTDLPF